VPVHRAGQCRSQPKKCRATKEAGINPCVVSPQVRSPEWGALALGCGVTGLGAGRFPLLLRHRLMLLRLRMIVVIVIVIRVKLALAIRAEQQDKGDR
jgi:hypothetical protein